jgi:hypothetical protein
MQDGHDEDLVGPGQIDDPVALIDQLAHIVAALGLGNVAADLGELRQLLDGGDDALGGIRGQTTVFTIGDNLLHRHLVDELGDFYAL